MKARNQSPEIVTGDEETVDQISELPENLRNRSSETVTGVEETLDRISELPEALLVQILSLMPTKDAFRTCLISKRWHYLWTLVENLFFTYGNISADNIYTDRQHSNSDDLMSFVDFVLAHHSSFKIKMFALDFCYQSKYDSQIDRCLSFAAENKVEVVVLELDSNGDIYTLPQSICNCSSLITLDLKDCGFDNKGLGIDWKFLKSISLFTVVLDDDGIVNLLSGCPALETMELVFFYGFRRLEIKSSNLKSLTLSSYAFRGTDRGDHSLEIFAPYLQHLEISGSLKYLKCKLLNVSSVVNACLTFGVRCINRIRGNYDADEDSCRGYHLVFLTLVQEYLQKLSHATELTIGSWFAEVLLMLQLEGLPLPEIKCKCLSLWLDLSIYNVYGVASLLQVSPHVETLIIDTGAMFESPRRRCNFELRYLDRGDNIDLKSWVPNFVFPNLKNIKIVSSFGLCIKKQFEVLFRLSEYLLKEAMVLETFVIFSKRGKCSRCLENCVSLYLSLLAEKLLGCPRSSSNVVITFHESPYHH